jgi:MFS transporter, OFA family, oxalate/formate antiporter
MVGAALLVNFAYAVQFNSNFGVYVYTMGADMGWGRTAIAGVQSVGRLPEALGAMFLGPVVDRHGARWLIAGGAVVVALSYLALATIQDLWQLYVYRGLLMSVGAMAMGGFLTVAISNWFVSKRARALSIAGMGGSLGTATLPLATAYVIDQWGWRFSWVAQAGLTLLLAIPAVVLFRRRPEDVGLRPDGFTEEGSGQPLDERQRQRQAELLAADVVWTRRQVMRTSTFWFTAIAYGVSAMALTATNLHIIPFIQDLGYPIGLAAGAVALRAAVVLVAQPMWGIVIERSPLRAVQFVPFAFQGLAMLLFLLFPTPAGIVAGLVMYGIGGGGSGVMQETIWAHFFGRISLGTVRSAVWPLQMVLGAAGPVALGLAYDLTGSYARSWLFLALGFFLGGILIFQAKRPAPPPVPSSRLL